MAASAGNLECVEYLLASRPEIDIYRKASSNLTPKEIALGTGKNEVAKLLEAFEADPEGIRKQLSRKLKLYDGDHVRLFIVVVLLCDHYFELPPSIENGLRIFVFFSKFRLFVTKFLFFSLSLSLFVEM